MWRRLAPAMQRYSVLVAFLVVVGCQSASGTPKATSGEPMTPTSPASSEPITITDPSQREAAVGASVVVIGIQTRTKQPQVNGVDVDGDYKLSDTKVIARGILKKTVVAEEPASKDGLRVASRGAGTFFAVIDPATKKIAKTKPAD
jgi:hypothetical protein